MKAEIHIGFVTGINELVQRAQVERMAVRRQARAELTAAIATFAGVALRDLVGFLKQPCSGSTATG